MRRVILYIVISIAFARSARAADLVLPIYAGEHAVTVPVVVNPTSADIKFPDSQICDLTGCHVLPGIVVKAGARFAGSAVVPRVGLAGLLHLSIPDGLIAYAEITTGAGALFRVPAMPAVEVAKFYDVAHEGPYNGFLFIGSDAATDIDLFGIRRSLVKDEALILPTPASGQFTIVTQLGAPHFYVFAGINSQVNGSLQIVQAR